MKRSVGRQRPRGAGLTRLAVVLFLAAAASVAGAQVTVYTGALEAGDDRLGRYFDTYPIQLGAGDRLILTLASPDFDALLLVEAPDGTELENDDFGEASDARLDFIAAAAGTWKVKATSFDDSEEGSYTLKVIRERIGQPRRYAGALEESDPVALKGEHYDTYPLEARQGQRIVVSLQSAEFDTFLVLKTPSGKRITADDFQDEGESRLDTVVQEDGAYELYVTSFKGEEFGAYTLTVVHGGRAQLSTREGTLSGEDPVLEGYGHYHTHPLTLRAGQHVIVEMVSSQLDTFLVVQGPDGSRLENDDYNDDTSISRVEVFAEAGGRYTVTTAGYEEGATGEYELRVYVLSGGAESALRGLPAGALSEI